MITLRTEFANKLFSVVEMRLTELYLTGSLWHLQAISVGLVPLKIMITVPASGKLTIRVRPFNETCQAARASAGYRGQENFCYFRKLLTFVGVINF